MSEVNTETPVESIEGAESSTDQAVVDESKSWYVVSAYAGYEKKIAEAIRERIELSDQGSKFGEVLVPAEEVLELRAGQKRRSERKFFPGYILIHMEMDTDTWQLVKQTPRVKGFVGGTMRSPVPISDAEADLILDRVQQSNQTVAPKVVYSSGELVRVIDGPFNDFNGVVEEVNYEKSRLVVAVTIFGRSTPVELDFSQVEKG